MYVYKTMREINMNEDDIELVVVEKYPCETRQEASARVRYYRHEFSKIKKSNKKVQQELPTIKVTISYETVKIIFL